MPINAFLLLRKRSVLLSIISLLLFASGAHADEWGDYTYRVDNGTSVTILGYLGTGGEISIPSEINGLPVTAINGSAFLNRVEITGSLVIPDGVTTIGWGAFSGCSGLNGTLTLPESLNTIGGHSFFNCTGLRGSVDVPAEVSYVGTYAFNGCVGLESIVFLGNAPSTFGTDVFTGTAAGFTLYCAADATGFTTPLWNGYPMLRWAPESDFVCETTWAGLWGITGYSGSAEHLVIPGIIGGKAVEMIAQTSLGSWDASTAPTFSSVDIPPSVKRIEQSAFRNCVNLAAVRLPEGLQILEGYAFYGCSGLTEVRLPSTLTEFYGNSFTGCSSLTSFEVAPGHPNAKSVNGLVLDQAGEALLLYPEGRTGIAVIPEGIKTIGGSVFYGCEGFTGFSLPSTLLEIGDYAFGCWSGVHELTIPDSVTTIGENAFSGSSFGSVTVGTGVLSLGHYAFESCSNLGWVRFMGNAPALGGDVFSDARSGFTVYYEAGATGFDGAEWVSQAVPLAQWNPAVDPNWLVEDDGSGVKLLGYSMPADNLVIPNTINGKTVVSIAASAFQFKTIFSGSVTIGSGVTSIEEGAFRGASNLTAILVDAANPSFASQSGLLYNKALSSLIACPGGSEGALSVPSGTVEIGHGAFESCAKLTSIHLPASVQVFEGIDTLACRALSAFTVDEENSTLKAENGVLFSKDSLTLVRCPEGKTGTISIPSDVTTVAPYAFQGCTLLTGELSLPSGLNTIGDYAFNNCTGLSGTLAIPAGVTSIGEFAFNYCIGLSGSLELPSGLTSIGQFAFANCSGFTGSLVIPSGVTEIEGVFAGCSGLTSVTIPGGVTSLPDYAFGGCSALESVTFLGNAPTMGDFVFGYGGYNQPVGLKLYYIAGASGFTTPTWYGFPCEEWVEDPVDPNWSYSSAIGEVTIIGYSGAGHNLVIPATIDGLPVTAIAEVAFLERTDLSGSFTLGANVSSIGSSAFWGCTNLTGFVVDGANATYASVDGVLFSKDLSTLLLCAQGKTGTCSIPSGTDSIESGAFSGCQTVTSLVVDGANATYASVDGVLFSKDLSTLLLCPQGKAGSYAIPSGTDSIESGAFNNCGQLTSVTIPASVTSIVDNPFTGCSQLTAFVVDPGSSSYQVSGGMLLTYDGKTLVACPGAKTGSVVIPQGVETIGAYSFFGLAGLSGQLVLPDGLKILGQNAFCECTGFTGPLDLPDTLEQIDYGVFAGCTSLTGDIVIPALVTTLGGGVFNGCTGFTGTLSILGPIETLGWTTFGGCSGLSGQPVLPDSITLIQGSVFAGCIGFTGELVLPAGLTKVEYNAFAGCSGISSIRFPAALNELYHCAFYNCSALTEAIFLGNAPTMGSEVFGNAHSSFTVKYKPGATGFTTPTWQGYPCEEWVEDPLDPNWQYTIADNEVTITGYTGVIENLVIPDTIEGLPVTAIGDSAFSGSQNITGTLTLPDGLNTIGEGAFYECIGLTGSLVIPEGVTSIGNVAFSFCFGFTGDLAIPQSVSTIADFAFVACGGLTSITVDADNPNYKSVDGVLLSKDGTILILCPGGKIGSLAIPDGVTTIADFACFDCQDLTGSLEIPQGVTSIGESAFDGCLGLTSVTIPYGVEVIKEYAFASSYALESAIFLGNAPTTMGPDVFDDAHSSFTVKYTPGATGFTTPTWQGYPCEEWVEAPVDPNWQYEIADSEVTITGYTGVGHNLVVPATIEGLPVTAIGDSAFFERTDLSGSFTLRANINSIGSSAFWGCTNLTGFVVDGANSYFASVDGVLFSEDLYLLLLCPQGKAGAYSIPAETATIELYAFAGCSLLTSVTMPSGVETIQTGAFWDCTLLTSVTIPASVTSIVDNPFMGCSQLTAFVVDPGSTSYQVSGGMLLTYDGKTLVACPGGKTGSVVIPQGVETIGASCFAGMAGLSGQLVLPDGLKVLGASAFSGCTGFTGPLDLPDTLEQIEWSAFAGCTGFTGDLVIPASVTTLGGRVFFGCTGFTGTLSILGPIETLEYGSFGGCSGLSGQPVLPDSITVIQGYVFSGCTGFTGELVLPSNLTDLGTQAFDGCSGIASVRIPSAVNQLGVWSFHNCTSLVEAIFLGNAPTMMGSGFEGAHSSFKVKYKPGATGFTTPTWQGYPCEEMVTNRAPRFRLIGNKTIKAGQKITFQVIADDEDAGDVLQYSATNP